MPPSLSLPAHRRLWQLSSKTSIAMASVKSAAYSTNVAKILGRSTIPEEAASNPHHQVKNGAVVGFKNPYPSYSNPVNFGTIMRRVIW